MPRLAYIETLEHVLPGALSEHLEARSFQPDGAGVWRRGSRLGGWVGVSPYTWPAWITISGRDVAMRVRAAGRLKASAARFWDTEWELLCRAAAGQPVPIRRAQQRHEAALIESSVLTVGAAVFGGVAAATVGIVYGRRGGMLVGTIVTGAVLGAGNYLLREEQPARER
ncbi:MAG: hypothetical protein ACI8S6_006032 [Myxococcota bacterium]|jgi:hypothetical protein